MKGLYNLIAGIFRSVSDLYLDWLMHRDSKKYEWLDDYPYYPSHAEVIAGQIERYNKDRPVEEQFDIERDSFKKNNQISYDRFYPIDDGT